MNIGIDIIRDDRFRTLSRDRYSFWVHVFSDAEWEYAFKDSASHLHLAGMFAAKEACMKAAGKVGQSHYRTFEIGHDMSGAPFVKKGGHFVISISHADGMVVAVVILQ